MTERISKQDALNIVLRYLAASAQKNCARSFKLYDGVPDGLPLYLPSEKDRQHCWCICVPLQDRPCVGAGRYIGISKDTGEIIFDGRAEE